MSGHVPTVVEIADTPVDQLPPLIHVPPLTKPFDVTIRPPGSKSLTNRALLLAALAEGTSTLKHALVDADDAQVMLRAIQQLGAKVEQPDAETLKITGVAGRWKIPAGQTVTLNLNNAGTATRFLTAAAILAPPESGGIIIDGNARMRERPIGELVDALLSISAKCEYLAKPGFPPVRVAPGDTELKREVTFGRTSSSQFISAMMMIAPFLPKGLVVQPKEAWTSMSYIWMTQGLMDAVGLPDEWSREGGTPSGSSSEELEWRPARLAAFDLEIEPDATGASYFFAAAAMSPNCAVALAGLSQSDMLQMDVQLLTLLHSIGGIYTGARDGGVDLVGDNFNSSFEWDFSNIPDTAMTAAVVACFGMERSGRPGTSTLRGLRTLRVKETDRIAALVTELAKVGVKVEPFADGDDEAIRITPPPDGIDCSPSAPRVEFDTYDDHRMAMSLALIGLRRPNVYIRDPACVRKTYPTYWRDLAKLYG